jgi:hypothetical protein
MYEKLYTLIIFYCQEKFDLMATGAERVDQAGMLIREKVDGVKGFSSTLH